MFEYASLPRQTDSQTGGVEGGGKAGEEGEDELDGGLQHDQPAQQPGELGSPAPAHPVLRGSLSVTQESNS